MEKINRYGIVISLSNDSRSVGNDSYCEQICRESKNSNSNAKQKCGTELVAQRL